MKKDLDSPQVKYPPPAVFIFFIGLAITLDQYVPFALGLPARPAAIAGGSLVLFGLIIIVTAWLTFKVAKTAIEPWKTTTTLVTHGIYRLSRNPIYIGMACVNLGLGIFFDSVWVMLSFVPALWCVYQTAIKKEETYLAKKFGETYATYKQHVRRWL